MTSGGDLFDRVGQIVRDVSAAVIEPRFRAIDELEVREKSAGEYVTAVDEEAERLLTARLVGILPGTAVVAEEACARDPNLVHALLGERAWLIDPLDGTANFMAGSAAWAMMVALVNHGATVASWIWRPIEDRMYVAERGGGAACNGGTMRRDPASGDVSTLRGVVLTRFLEAATLEALDRNRSRFARLGDGSGCAGVDYPSVLHGDDDFVLYWRTLPWDHAPGALLAAEAGATILRLDGSAYLPTQTGVGLLLAADTRTWASALSELNRMGIRSR